ncbi:diguanylate cyclase [Paludibacterium yongneupense]|uniref:diguanylate cyclase n=1 Tax=Paludibacterium yongneupense TaxID=400061 RepID=UPI0004103174|nr:diguanylate cyclase [Paludibacterium yongneupense]
MFDIKTTFLLIIVVNFSLGLTILPAAESERDSGLFKVSLANITHGLGYLFFIMSGQYYKDPLVWMGEVFIVISIVVWYSALCQFLKIKTPVIILALAVLYNAVVSFIFVESKEGRILFNSISIIIIELLFLFTLLSNRKSIKGRGKFIVLLSVFVNLLILLYREEFSLSGGTVKYLFDRGPSQAALYVSVLTTLICFSLGFVLMAKERTDYLNRDLILKDSLTGLWNRRRLDEVGRSELARHIRYALPTSLALIDIDNFKQINDRHGHRVGDEILAKVAAACVKKIRDTDVLGRWGGEEFMAIFPGTSVSDLAYAAEQIREAVNGIEIEPGKKVSVSIGLSSCLSSDSWESWFERADAALYHAKSEGKNTAKLDFPTIYENGLMLIRWGNEFQTGISSLDEEHSTIISMVNDWIRLPKEEHTKNFICKKLEVIRTDIGNHFKVEEKTLFSDHDSEDGGHKNMHDHLDARFRFLIDRFNNGLISIDTINQFIIYELCVQHILIYDKSLNYRNMTPGL